MWYLVAAELNFVMEQKCKLLECFEVGLLVMQLAFGSSNLQHQVEQAIEDQADDLLVTSATVSNQIMLQTRDYIHMREAGGDFGKDNCYMKVPLLAAWVQDKGNQIHSQPIDKAEVEQELLVFAFDPGIH
ncbi:hypothetical protein Tsubulata_044672 [Turnera subulata]|uniref:Uncharacterized protein n=1 Tax=Turnera subulata TaxID=218843 RepID=A0A9Q0JS36_9ROSI|nr:hypothetical protein Tsubulata_044672 [Turnera subulata]